MAVFLHVYAPADPAGGKLLKPDLPLSRNAKIEQLVSESGVLRLKPVITKQTILYNKWEHIDQNHRATSGWRDGFDGCGK